MRITKAWMMVAGALFLSACTSAIPDSGVNQVNLNSTANYEANSPEFFVNTVGDRVLFLVDKSTLSNAAQTILDAQATWLMQNPEFKALIEGNTDERGTREYNLALGARRASAVKAYLVSRGVAGNRLSTVTYGKERPIAICSNESCWSQNRRAVSVVTVAGTS